MTPLDTSYIEKSVSDAITAQAVVLAFVAVFFGIAYAESTSAIRREPGVDTSEITEAIGDLRRVLLSRAAPLTVMSVAATLVYLPLAVRIVVDTWVKFGPVYLWDYDLGQTSFVLIVALLVYFSGLSIAQALRICRRMSVLQKKRAERMNVGRADSRSR